MYNGNDAGQRTITYTITANASGLKLVQLTVGKIKNPNSVRYLTTFIVTCGTETDSDIPLSTYTEAALASASVSNAVQTAGSANKVTFTFRITNNIPRYGLIQIKWPDEVKFKQSSADTLTTATIYGGAVTGFTTTVSQSSKTITINGLFASNELVVQANDIVIVIDKFNNPESQITSGSFKILTMNSASEGIDKQETGLTISSTLPGTIAITTFLLSSYSADAQFTAQFYETTDLSPSSAYLRIYWPSEVTYVTSGTLKCEMSFGFDPQTPPCTVDTTNKYMTLRTYWFDTHLYTVGTFQNPLGAITSSSWKLIVYDSSNNIIMQALTGITATSKVNAITVTSSTRPSTATTVGIRADYTIVFTVATRMLSSSKIKLVFPKEQVLYDAATGCYNGATSLSCTLADVDTSKFSTEITQWCNTGAE